MHQLFAANRCLHALFAGELTNQNREYYKVNDNIQLLDEAEQNIVIYQWRADQLFADAEGRGK